MSEIAQKSTKNIKKIVHYFQIVWYNTFITKNSQQEVIT